MEEIYCFRLKPLYMFSSILSSSSVSCCLLSCHASLLLSVTGKSGIQDCDLGVGVQE